jgi:hypothetical protein
VAASISACFEVVTGTPPKRPDMRELYAGRREGGMRDEPGAQLRPTQERTRELGPRGSSCHQLVTRLSEIAFSGHAATHRPQP